MLPRLLMHRDWYVFPAWAHPQVRYWGPTWMIIRDCLLGDQEIKDKGETYLPRMADMDGIEYDRYLDSAVFFNMTARTVNALVGTIFQRDPKIEGIPKSLDESFAKVIWNGISMVSFMTGCAEGLVAMGRYGILCDMPEKGGTPFIRGYDAENIVDWQMDWVDGRYVPVQIILREFIEINTRTVGEIRKYKIIYRVLSLDFDGQQLITTPSNTNPTLSEQSVATVSGERMAIITKNAYGAATGGGPLSNTIPTGPGGTPEGNTFEISGGAIPIQASPIRGGDGRPVYRQYIYTVNNITSPLNTVTPEIVTPTNRGQTLDFIPFIFLGAKDNTPDVDRPPAADIARLNLAHYRSYAHLEHGRYFCAMPIYYVQVLPHSERTEYTLGPSRVWEVAAGERPGILEFNGQGLKTLENSLQQKEEQIALLGGRLAGGLARSVSESDNQAKMKEANERALLMKVISNIQDGLAQCLKWWAWWQDQPNVEPGVDLNAEFIFDNLGARELRAAHQMFADGVIPATVLHIYLQKAGLVPEWMDGAEFKSLLDDINEFPNRPDIWARKLGYSDAANMHEVRLERRALRNQEALTAIAEQQADQDKLDIEGNIDVKQQLADTQQQLADQQGDQIDHEQEMAQQQQDHKQQMDKKQQRLNHQLSQQQLNSDYRAEMTAATSAGKPVVNNPAKPPTPKPPTPKTPAPKNPNSTPLPSQVSAARNAAEQAQKLAGK